MPEEVIYRAENGAKMLFRSVFFVGLLIVCAYFWEAAPIFFSIGIVFCLYQILLYKYSSIIVFRDKITYQNKNLVNAGTEVGTINYREVYGLEFSPSEVDGIDFFINGLLAVLFPLKKNEVTVMFTDNKNRTMRWGGNVYEVQVACEKANEIISQEFNRPQF
jgi:hypothetical protein